MNFKLWLENEEAAHQYFSIGHGDDDEPYIVWAYINGKIKTSPSGTHGSNWSHDITDYNYKGRYEPESGKLSIVKPARWLQREIPNDFMNLLKKTFKYITDIKIF